MLCEAVAPFEGKPKLGATKKCCEFAEGIRQRREEVPAPFKGEGLLFVSADPFGGTGIPLSTFAECMQAKRQKTML
jgi:hypothetical protein